jgi:hypothetical protein
MTMPCLHFPLLPLVGDQPVVCLVPAFPARLWSYMYCPHPMNAFPPEAAASVFYRALLICIRNLRPTAPLMY